MDKYYTIYLIEDKEFNKQYKGYKLHKIGYVQGKEDSIRYRVINFPYNVDRYNTQSLLTIKDKELNTHIMNKENEVRNEFIQRKELICYPYNNRVRVKQMQYPIPDMWNYLNEFLIEGNKDKRSNWGSTEWFIIKE
jgi:hypothetical protein